MSNTATKVITAVIKQVLERYRVNYDIKIDALIANLTDIVACNEHLTERETHARLAAHFAQGPLETVTPDVVGNSQLNGATVKPSRSILKLPKPITTAKAAAYAERQRRVVQRAKRLAMKKEGEP